MSSTGWSMPLCTVDGDHHYLGSSQCQACGERLRCICGCYVREDNLGDHLARCRVVDRTACGACRGTGLRPVGTTGVNPCDMCSGSGIAERYA